MRHRAPPIAPLLGLAPSQTAPWLIIPIPVPRARRPWRVWWRARRRPCTPAARLRAWLQQPEIRRVIPEMAVGKMVGERGNQALRTHNPPQEPTAGAIHRIIAPRAIRRRIAIRTVNDNRQTPDNLVPSTVITRAAGGDQIPKTHRAVDVGGEWARAAPQIGDREASDTHDARQPVGGLSRGCHSTDQ